VVPNGVDLDYFRPTGEPREPATLVFSGKMSYHANHTAALYLLNEVMPLVWRERRDVRVMIVGAGPAPSLQRLAADPRVMVTGYVPDLRPYLARATVAVCPIRYGVGVQNKVLEALAMGAPVITARQTTVALAQLTGRELLVADNAAEFAVGVVQLLGQPEACELLGGAGRAYVEAQYSWDRSALALEQCYHGVVAGVGAR
jgi:polysaccharide biosynthesis protein PslH